MKEKESSEIVSMNFTNVSNSEMQRRMKKLVRTERKITHLVLLHILEFESRKLYADLGYDRMYSYLTKHLGYSDFCAYARLQSAQMLKKAPVISEKLEDGSLNLTQLAEMRKCIRHEEQKGQIVTAEQTLDILSKIENKNSFQTKQVLAVEFNQPIKENEVVKPQRDESVRLELSLTKEEFEEMAIGEAPNVSPMQHRILG